MSTDPDRTLAAIDAAVEAWERGPDAYRWEPDAEPGLRDAKSFGGFQQIESWFPHIGDRGYIRIGGTDIPLIVSEVAPRDGLMIYTFRVREDG